jgi:hypothetical protein
MKRSHIVARPLICLTSAVLFAGGCGTGRADEPAAVRSTEVAGAAGAAQSNLLYGRVTGVDGTVYEGRLRFGTDEEALWGNYFNGFKAENPWAALVPRDRAPREHMEIFAIELPVSRRSALGRPFMARFGDITRIEARGRDLRVTLKSGTVVQLDRYAADDFADGIRVWDGARGVVDLGERQVRSIEFLPEPGGGAAPAPLFGTVHTRQGTFTGLIQWDRVASLTSDQLYPYTSADDVDLRFDAIRSIRRQSDEAALVTLLNGREVSVSTLRGDRNGDRGMYVDDPRYGRVLVSWQAFERVDFAPAGAGRAYGDFPPGAPLTGTVTTRSGQRLAGRLVYDLDESETTETLDAPSRGVDYTVPFGQIASITPGARGSRVVLRGGEQLQLEPAGDLGATNAGILVFVQGRASPVYVAWADVAQIQLDAPVAASGGM